MRYSNATCYYYEFSPEDAIKHFSASGWDCVELSHEHSQVLLERGGNLEETGRKFVEFAKNLGVDIPQAHLSLQCDITDKGTVDTLKSWLEMYMGMGVKAAVLHPGGHVSCKKNKSITLNEMNDLRASALRELTGFIKGTDMSICLENVGYIYSAEQINELIDYAGISENIGICLDTGHLNNSYHKMDGFLPHLRQGAFIRTAGSRLKALHVHDNDGKSDMHLMPYTYGNVDFAEVICTLKEIGYDGLFNLEIPSEARDLRTGQPYPLEVRYVKSKYLIDLYKMMVK